MKKIIFYFSLIALSTLHAFAQDKHQKKDVWVDRFDFETSPNSTFSYAKNNQTVRGETWTAFTDYTLQGESTVSKLYTISDSEHGKVMELQYNLSAGQSTFPPYVGVFCSTQAETYPKHIVYVAYDFKGPYHSFIYATSDITDYNYYRKSVPPSAEWKTVMIPLSELKQENVNGKIVTFDPEKLNGIEWIIQGKDGEKGSLIIDNIRFVYTPIESKNYAE